MITNFIAITLSKLRDLTKKNGDFKGFTRIWLIKYVFNINSRDTLINFMQKYNYFLIKLKNYNYSWNDSRFRS